LVRVGDVADPGTERFGVGVMLILSLGDAAGAGQQALFFTFVAPLWDLFFAVGIASAGLHAEGTLSLSVYWLLISLISTLPLVALLLVRRG
jgi:hypothetical protein